MVVSVVRGGRGDVVSGRRETTVVVDVLAVERIGCTVNGNPRYRLICTGQGRPGGCQQRNYITSSDSACSYSVSNLMGRASRTGSHGITLVLTPAGRVCDFYRVIDGKQVRP